MYRQTGSDEATRGWRYWLKKGFDRGPRDTLRYLFALGPRGLAQRLYFLCRLIRVYLYNVLFDLRQGTETAAGIAHYGLKMPAASQTGASWYVPVPARSFCFVMDHLDVDVRAYTFVDIGAGKGKAMCLAAAYPFSNIIGVELADNVIDVARKNLQRFHRRKRRCEHWALVQEDACNFNPPSVPLFLFLYSPFSHSGIENFLENLERWRRLSAWPVILCFVDDVGYGSLLPEVTLHCTPGTGWKRLALAEIPPDPGALFAAEVAVFKSMSGET